LATKSKIQIEIETILNSVNGPKQAVEKIKASLDSLQKLKIPFFSKLNLEAQTAKSTLKSFIPLLEKVSSIKTTKTNAFSQIFSQADIGRLKQAYGLIKDIDTKISTTSTTTKTRKYQNILGEGYFEGVKDLLGFQARWYAARFALFTAVELPVDFIKRGIQYSVLLDEWNAKLLRWGASSGEVTEKAKQDISSLVLDMRKATLEIPVTFDQLAKSVEGFIGAGVSPENVRGMVKELAALTSTYPDINMEQFGTAIVGFYNTFKGSIKGATTEAGKFKIIMDQMVAAQAKGVIRPEAFTLVTQHLGEAAKMAGFTTEQMLAMAVVVTDLGSKAGSAARSLRGFFDQIAKKSVQKKLEIALGFKPGTFFDMNKTLAEQFDHIMTTIKEKLNVKGELPLGLQQFFGTIMTTERMKSFTAMLRDWDKYKTTIQDIMSSTGGVMAGVEPKLKSIAGQWQLFKTTLDELASGATLSTSSLAGIVTILLDVARAALYAVNPLLATKEKIEGLSEAGKTTYAVILNLKDVLIGLWAGLGPVIGILGSLALAILQCKEAIVLFCNILFARLAIGALMPVLSGLKSLFMSISILGIIDGIKYSTIGFANAIAGLVSPANMAAVALGLLITVAANYYNQIKKIQQETKSLIDNVRNFSTQQRNTELAKAEYELFQLEQQDSVMFVGKPRPGNVPDSIRAKALKEQIAALKSQNAVVEHYGDTFYTGPEEVEPQDKGKVPPDPGEKTKGLSKSLEKGAYKNLKEELHQQLEQINLHYKDVDEAIDSSHNRNLSSEEEYYTALIQIAKSKEEDKLAILYVEQKKWEDLKPTLDTDVSRTKDTELKNQKIEAYRLQGEAIKTEILKVNSETYKLITDNEDKLSKALQKKWYERVQLKDKIEKDSLDTSRELVDIEIDLQTERIKLLEDRGFITQEQWYATERIRIQENTKLQLLRIEEDLQRDLVNLRAKYNAQANQTTGYLSPDLQIISDLEEASLRNAAAGKQDIATTKGISDIAKSTNDAVRNVKNVSAAFDELRKSYGDFNKWGYDTVLGIANGIRDGVTSIFSDIRHNELKSFEDYFLSFADKIMTIWDNLVGEMIVKWLFGIENMKGNSGGNSNNMMGGILGTVINGVIGMFGGGSSIGGTTNVTGVGTAMGLSFHHQGGVVGIKSFHSGGLNSDERMVINKVGERYITQEQNDWLNSIANSTKGSGETQPVYNISISAVDSKSFVDMLNKDPNAIVKIVDTSLRKNEGFRQTVKRTTR
jgi:hypothetical protein